MIPGEMKIEDGEIELKSGRSAVGITEQQAVVFGWILLPGRRYVLSRVKPVRCN